MQICENLIQTKIYFSDFSVLIIIIRLIPHLDRNRKKVTPFLKVRLSPHYIYIFIMESQCIKKIFKMVCITNLRALVVVFKNIRFSHITC